MRTLSTLLFVSLIGCGGGSVMDAGDDRDVGDSDRDAGMGLDVGDLTTGPLRIEILDPVTDQVIVAEPAEDAPMLSTAHYDVRARISGEGADSVTDLVGQSTEGVLVYYGTLVDGPEGRVATMSMGIGRYLPGDAAHTVAIRVGIGMPVPDTDVVNDIVNVTIQPL